MPEGDTIYRAARALQRAIGGRGVAGFETGLAKLARGKKGKRGGGKMRVVIKTADWEGVFFNVPIAEFYTARSLERSSQVPKLGPDILSDEFTVEGDVARLAEY